MSLCTRKLLELKQKLASLNQEFAWWRDESEPNKSLEKHNSQIRRITYQLEGLQKVISTRLKDIAGTEEHILAACQELDHMILELHRIWEYFRRKLALRRVERFQAYLEAADDYAWLCYQAAQAHVSQEKKAPPLVFFNGGASPIIIPRDWSFEAESVPSDRIRTEEFIHILRHLPIPVIGIPWSQLQHLPDALTIGHEVGHCVKNDFDISACLQETVVNALTKAQVPMARRVNWCAWLEEIFADFYGILAGGPAFVGTLMDFMAADVQTITAETLCNPEYPTVYLRILLDLEILLQLGFKQESDHRKTDWQSVYAHHAMTEFENDLPVVAGALVDGTFPTFQHGSIKDILCFSTHDHQEAMDEAERALKNYRLQAKNVRILFAASRLAFEKDPETYSNQGAHERFFSKYLDIREKGFRIKRHGIVDARSQEAFDREAGAKLYEMIQGMMHSE
jgi:hypothetical protein